MGLAVIVERVHLTRVDFPQGHAKPTAHNVLSKHSRTIVRLQTNDGLTGYGECSGDPDIWRLACRFAEGLIGRDPRAINARRFEFARMNFHQRNGRNGHIAFGGVESACWDLAARACGRPLCDLFGGAVRDEIDLVVGLSAVSAPPGTTRAEVEAMLDDLGNVERVVEDARERIGEAGFGTIKIKSAAYRPQWDIAVLTALRTAFGPDMRLRIDPNGAYTPAQAIQLFTRLDELGLEFFEDPTRDIEGMARLRSRVTTPLATNMCVIRFEDIPPAFRLGAVDIVLGDVYHWGGIAAMRELIDVTDALGLGFAVHSVLESEWDIGIAVNLHVSAASPSARLGMNATLPSPCGGIITEPYRVREGRVAVPTGPGLGIELDENKINSLREDEFRTRA